MNNVFSVAQYIYELSKKNNRLITPMKLLKLTYICYGWYSIGNEDRLFYNEIQAWKYGPVIPDLYDKIKIYHTNPVNDDIGNSESLDDNKKKWIEKIYSLYKGFTGNDLSNMTHIEGSPWHQVYDKSNRYEIPDNIIKDYYKKLYEESRQDTN